MVLQNIFHVNHGHVNCRSKRRQGKEKKGGSTKEHDVGACILKRETERGQWRMRKKNKEGNLHRTTCVVGNRVGEGKHRGIDTRTFEISTIVLI